MAGKEKKQAGKVRFELTWGGIVGIAVICFCIFIWMFLLGVWTGQSLLQPSSSSKETASGRASALIAPLLQAEPDRKNGPVK